MRWRNLLLVFLLLCLFATSAAADSSANYTERGRYVYLGENNQLPVQVVLGFSYILYWQDAKTGYETVLHFPLEKMTVEEMGAWFDSHGVGKTGRDDGLVLFIFPDGSVYGMYGAGHDRIATPLLTDVGDTALANMSEDQTLAILSALNMLGEPLTDPTKTEEDKGVADILRDNLDLFLVDIGILAGAIFLFNLRDGYQPNDVKLPLAVFFLAFFLFGGMMLLNAISDETDTDYGIITATHKDSHWITVPVTHSDGKRTWTTYEQHRVYTNDVTILSYGHREYGWCFESRDWDSAWDNDVGDLRSLKIYMKNKDLVSVGGIHDNSGGRTNRNGCWMVGGSAGA